MPEDSNNNSADQIVIDKAQSKLSDLWKLEDYWAIWLGFIILIIALIIFIPYGTKDIENEIIRSNDIMRSEAARAPFKTVAWFEALDKKEFIYDGETEVNFGVIED